ncbi:hypothetical protein BV22DRAFT_1028926 [Leucogyrophana mollusca]|uniref:Uncharacterized protein n=1 Tax=Leucogyrophana mollusca TaxID=85980 RepID=A0ACB8BYN5_9AGAM|nr:hypothetical protein BV22DRAFT_1028926 [Leucogyrophana mollusca]
MAVPDLVEAFDEFVFNDIPARFIYIPEMRFMERQEVRNHYAPRIELITEKYIQDKTSIRHRWDISRKDGLNEVVKKVVKYAMFSHRWSNAEPAFQDMTSFNKKPIESGYTAEPTSPSFLDDKSAGTGHEKLMKFLQKAGSHDCDLAWSDTCCIDKTSSAELEEAIRSMFRWYRNSDICIAYLSQSTSVADFLNEVYFTRAWTLQELLAPRAMKFYGRDWKFLGAKGGIREEDKKSRSLKAEIEKVTKIPYADISDFRPGTDRVHDKMLWASQRKATRTEDVAYSLIGLFDITMPIAYGEGKWAFHRLMEILMQRCEEWQIFAWAGQSSQYSSGIAESPKSYYPIPIARPSREHGYIHRGDKLYKSTKRGVKLRLLLVIPCLKQRDNNSWVEVDNHRYNSYTLGFDSEKSTHDGILEELTVRVKDSQVSNSFKVAVGILDYVPVESDASQGALIPRRDYVPLLLHADRAGQSDWKRVPTDKILAVSCRKHIQCSLTTVWL